MISLFAVITVDYMEIIRRISSGFCGSPVLSRLVGDLVQTLTGTTSSVRRTWRRPWTSWPKGSWRPRRSRWCVTKPSRRPTSTETTSSHSPTLRTWSPRLLTFWGTVISSVMCSFFKVRQRRGCSSPTNLHSDIAKLEKYVIGFLILNFCVWNRSKVFFAAQTVVWLFLIFPLQAVMGCCCQLITIMSHNTSALCSLLLKQHFLEENML